MISGLLTLPDEPPFSSRDEALQQLRFALRHGVSDSILECLAQLGTQRQLRDLILSILDGTNHPIAVRFVARELGKMDFEARQRNSYSDWASQWRMKWERDHDNQGPGLSAASIDELRLLWEDTAIEEAVRTYAFSVWARYTDDLTSLRAVPSSSVRFQTAAQQRALKGDSEIVPYIIEKVRGPALVPLCSNHLVLKFRGATRGCSAEALIHARRERFEPPIRRDSCS